MGPQTKEQEVEEAEEEEEGRALVKENSPVWGYAVILLVGGILGYWFHPDVIVEKVIDDQRSQLQYNQGRSGGINYGIKQERAEWCESERYKKPGDMTLKCLKLFLDGAGESIRQRNGVEIKTL
jgi:hypothetical protein